jgi:hypothetical protein
MRRVALAAAALLGASVDSKENVLLIDADVALTVPFPIGKDVDDDLAVIYAHLGSGPRIVSLTSAWPTLHDVADNANRLAPRASQRRSETRPSR